ncbi:MAG: hypothetical protein U0354_18485 [Candidatus Sericytochromatia bacterium]
MKNKFILSFLLIPVFVACQNTVNVSNSSSQQPSSASLNVNPSITVSNIQESTTPIIESNMEQIIKPSNKPIISEDYFRDISFRSVKGKVIDISNTPIPDAIINIYNYSSNKNLKYSDILFNLNIKSDEKGEFCFKVPVDMFIIGNAEKFGYSKRWEDFGILDKINFGYNYKTKSYLHKSPEINEIFINENKLSRYINNKFENIDLFKIIYNNYGNNVFKSFIYNQVNENTEIARFKLINTNKLKLKLIFNVDIDKVSLEKNILLESLDKKDRYDNKNMSFEWNNTKLVININLNKIQINTKYRLSFKNPFIDLKENEAIRGEYFAIQPPHIHSASYTELSENIVFEISGSK